MAVAYYENFDIQIELHDGRYRVRVIKSPAGEATCDCAADALRILRKSNTPQSELSSAELDTFGQHLYDAIFRDDVATCFTTSLALVRQQNIGLRIRFRLTDVPELATLPWEYLHGPAPHGYFALSDRTPVVRYLELLQTEPPLQVTLPLRILVVMATPTDVPQLHAEQEWQQLRKGLRVLEQRGLITLERLERATVSHLQQRLRQDDVHVLHYIGHGWLDSAGGTTGLLFENEAQEAELIDAASFGMLLRDESALRLVFLNSCEGASDVQRHVSSGTAQTLVRAGLPTVIAMQAQIQDEAAGALAYEFYRALADGYPVDAALSEARESVFLQGYKVEWGLPVLFMRATDGFLFHIEEGETNVPQRRLRRASPPAAPFLGPAPFQTNHAALFFGRNTCLDRIMESLLHGNSPLLVINGLSGVGKTSLLRAGLVAQLQEQGHLVAYCSILDSPKSDTIRGIYSSLALQNTQQPDTDILRVIDEVAQTDGAPFFLLIDQLERCFTLARDNAERLEFWRSIARLLQGETYYPTKVVLAVRSDWLYAFQEVSPTPLTISVFNFLFRLEPLTTDEAKEALREPLTLFQITFTPDLIDAVVTDLASEEGYVNPPQLQIVGEALYQYMKSKKNVDDEHLTLEDYNQLQGARTIIRQHLIRIVNGLGPNAQTCWQILLRLMGPDGVRISRPAEELRNNLNQATFQSIMAHLVSNALVVRELSSTDNIPVYTLTHDYLIEEIGDHVEQNQALQGWKTAERFLDAGLADWRDAKRFGQPEVLLERKRYLHVWTHRDALGSLSDEACEFLMWSALQHGEKSFSHWLHCESADASHVWEVLSTYLFTRGASVSERALCAVTAALSDNLLPENIQNVIHDKLTHLFETGELPPSIESGPTAQHETTEEHEGEAVATATSAQTDVDQAVSTRANRETAASLLWAMRSSLTLHESLQVAPVVAHMWFRAHRSQVVLPALSLLLIPFVTYGYLTARAATTGTWHRPERPLMVGQVEALAFVPDQPSTVYAITDRGPEPGNGATLLSSHADGQWDVISQSITTNPISALAVSHTVTQTRLYASVWGKGIIRSDDGGATWQATISGLSSYAIGSIVISSRNPAVIYAGSTDKHGIFRSTDGGDSWHEIGEPDLFGVSVLSMIQTSYAGGTLVVSTDDGRLFSRNYAEDSWQLLALYPRLGAMQVLAADDQGSALYAGTSRGYILFSGDGGTSWPIQSRIPGVLAIHSIAVMPDHPETVLVNAQGVGGYVLWGSSDYGQNWERIANGDFTREPLRLAPDPHGADVIYGYGAPGLFQSVNRGDTWTFSNIGSPLARIEGIAVSRRPEEPIYVSVGGAIFYSDVDGGDGWQRSGSLPTLIIRDMAVDPSRSATAYAAAYAPNEWSIFMTRDGGASWQPTATPPAIPTRFFNDTMALAIGVRGEEQILYAGTNGCGVIHSATYGASWETFGRSDCPTERDVPKNVIDLAIDAQSIDTLYAAADFTSLYTSRDRGRHWEHFALELTNEILEVQSDPIIAERVYLVAGSDGFWRSDNGGREWRQLPVGTGDISLTGVQAVPAMLETLFVSASNGEIWKTSNGGDSWTLIRSNLATSLITDLAYDIRTQELLLSSYVDGLHVYRAGSLENTWRFWRREETRQ